MLTTRGKGLLATAAALWIGSRVFGVPELTVAALASLALVVIAVAGVLVSSPVLHADRFVRPAKLSFGEHGAVQLTVITPRRRRASRIYVTETAPRALATPPQLDVSGLPAGGRTTVTY